MTKTGRIRMRIKAAAETYGEIRVLRLFDFERTSEPEERTLGHSSNAGTQPEKLEDAAVPPLGLSL